MWFLFSASCPRYAGMLSCPLESTAHVVGSVCVHVVCVNVWCECVSVHEQILQLYLDERRKKKCTPTFWYQSSCCCTTTAAILDEQVADQLQILKELSVLIL